MKKTDFRKLEAYMLECMKDAAHDPQHIYRVLTQALKIAENYDLNKDVLIAACLLHDIARDLQYHDPSICHALAGGDMAYNYLIQEGWDADSAAHVKECVQAHRFRTTMQPESIEAKILFDSDKLDATGAFGIARTLQYKGNIQEPIYSVDENNRIQYGEKDHPPSFFREYNQKLIKLYDLFYTKEAAEIAEIRRAAAVHFYDNLMIEIGENDYYNYI